MASHTAGRDKEDKGIAGSKRKADAAAEPALMRAASTDSMASSASNSSKRARTAAADDSSKTLKQRHATPNDVCWLLKFL
jgi:hypothetical protein